jgi:lysyl-tRNA synthetase class 1
VKPAKTYKKVTPEQMPAFVELRDVLKNFSEAPTPENLQTAVFEIGKRHPTVFPGLRDWFQALYQVLLGQDQGPRMGSFIALYGLSESTVLLDRAIAGENLAA